MGTTLTGTTPQDTYDSLIKVTDNGPLSGTAKYLSDGLGNDSVLALSTSRVGVGTNAPSYDLTLSKSVAAGNVVLQIENTSTTGSARLWFGNNANAAGARIQYFGATHAQRPNLFSIGTDVANDVMFETSGSERMRITSTGNVGIGASSPASLLTIQPANDAANTLRIYRGKDGGFEAQSAIIDAQSGNVNFKLLAADAVRYFSFQLSSNSGSSYTQAARIDLDGLKFGSDSAAANALDDYEEGTWTPTVGGTSGTATYTTQFGSYTKIGRQVTVNWFVAFQKNTLSGNVSLSGLPFALGNFSSLNYPQAIIMLDNLASAYTNPLLQLANGATTANIITNNGSTTSHAAMDATQLGPATMEFRGTATYFV